MVYTVHLAQCLLFDKQFPNDSIYYSYFVFEGSNFKKTEIIVLNFSFDGKQQLIQTAYLVNWAKSKNIFSLFILDCFIIF